MTPWWKAGFLALGVSALLAAGAARDQRIERVAEKEGYDRANKEWRAREAGIAQAAIDHAAIETTRARAATDALQEKFDNMADTRQKEKAQHEEDKRIAIAHALAGAERMRLPSAAAGGAIRDAGNGQGAELGRGVAPAQATYLLPETAATVLDIAADYGQLVRDYNAVVDRYADAERACNATKPTGD